LEYSKSKPQNIEHRISNVEVPHFYILRFAEVHNLVGRARRARRGGHGVPALPIRRAFHPPFSV
jgi:hypothetical protein